MAWKNIATVWMMLCFHTDSLLWLMGSDLEVRPGFNWHETHGMIGCNRCCWYWTGFTVAIKIVKFIFPHWHDSPCFAFGGMWVGWGICMGDGPEGPWEASTWTGWNGLKMSVCLKIFHGWLCFFGDCVLWLFVCMQGLARRNTTFSMYCRCS